MTDLLRNVKSYCSWGARMSGSISSFSPAPKPAAVRIALAAEALAEKEKNEIKKKK